MQTFLPYANFTKSAQCLDNKRLGKQRVECLQILNALTGKSKGWVNHPATKMWKGYELSLYEYMVAVVIEWKARGYKDTCLDKAGDLKLYIAEFKNPPWFGDEAFHASHRSNLLRKSDHYNKFGWTESTDLPYVWPV
jgi:hypothetical protein